MDYGQISDAAKMSQRPVNHEALCEQQFHQNAPSTGLLGSQKGDTELSALLTTIGRQALELRTAAATILSRVAPQPEDGCAEKQNFPSGYIGQAEQVRSTLGDAMNLLAQLAKFA